MPAKTTKREALIEEAERMLQKWEYAKVADLQTRRSLGIEHRDMPGKRGKFNNTEKTMPTTQEHREYDAKSAAPARMMYEARPRHTGEILWRALIRAAQAEQHKNGEAYHRVTGSQQTKRNYTNQPSGKSRRIYARRLL